MKLWYQSMARDEGMEGYFSNLSEVIREFGGEDLEVSAHGISRGGGTAELFRFFEFVDTRDVLANALRAEREGYDAFLIGNIAEPGIVEAREVTDFPVLGLCESSAHVASMMGATFGMVGFYVDKFALRIKDNIERYGFGPRYTGLTQMRSSTVENILQMNAWYTDPKQRETVADDFRLAASEAAANGAEVIIPAGGVLMALLAMEKVNEVDGTPILNGIAALLGVARLAVRLRALTGQFTSKSSTYASLPSRLRERVESEYGGDLEKILFSTRSSE